MAIATRPKPKVHHKKSRAKHHRHTKPYLKTYWPYIPMLAIVGVGLMVNSLWSNASVLGVRSDFSAAALLSETNLNRTKESRPALSINPRLSAAAQAKADDMARSGYWSHNSPNGKTPWAFISASGYQYQTAGENLAYGFGGADDTVKGWMNSQEHRDNILNANYRDVGFGIASSADYQGKGPATIVVAEYGQPAGSASLASAPNLEAAGVGGANVQGISTEQPSQPISRIAVLTGGQAAWSALALSAIAGAALAYFIIRHGVRLHRLWAKGEAFVVHHPLLDIAVVLVFTAGFVLTRASGIVG